MLENKPTLEIIEDMYAKPIEKPKQTLKGFLFDYMLSNWLPLTILLTTNLIIYVLYKKIKSKYF